MHGGNVEGGLTSIPTHGGRLALVVGVTPAEAAPAQSSMTAGAIQTNAFTVRERFARP
jgi:hypothetical protein